MANEYNQDVELDDNEDVVEAHDPKNAEKASIGSIKSSERAGPTAKSRRGDKSNSEADSKAKANMISVAHDLMSEMTAEELEDMLDIVMEDNLTEAKDSEYVGPQSEKTGMARKTAVLAHAKKQGYKVNHEDGQGEANPHAKPDISIHYERGDHHSDSWPSGYTIHHDGVAHKDKQLRSLVSGRKLSEEYDDEDLDEAALSPEKKKAMKLGYQNSTIGTSRSGGSIRAKDLKPSSERPMGSSGKELGRLRAAGAAVVDSGKRGQKAAYDKGAKAGSDANYRNDSRMGKHFDTRTPGKGGRRRPYVAGPVSKLPENYEIDYTDLNALVESEATLSQEFKAKTAVIFETAVKSQLSEEIDRLEEAYAIELEEEIAATKADLVEKVDSYLNYVVESWMEENKLAIQNGLRTEIAETFMSKLKDLFVESYVEVPESKVDLFDELTAANEELEEAANTAVARAMDLAEELETYKRDAIIRRATKGLAETQVAKLTALVEDIDFEDEATFAQKVKTIKESYFSKKTAESAIVEDMDSEVSEEVSSTMAQYIKAIRKSTN